MNESPHWKVLGKISLSPGSAFLADDGVTQTEDGKQGIVPLGLYCGNLRHERKRHIIARDNFIERLPWVRHDAVV